MPTSDKTVAATERMQDNGKKHIGSANGDHEANFAVVKHTLLSAGHFKKDRVENKKTVVGDMGHTNKKRNATQKPTQQELAAAVSGKIPFGELLKAKHMDHLEAELLHRGVAVGHSEDCH